MKEFIITTLALIPIFIFEFFALRFCEAFINDMLDRKRTWIRFFAVWVGMLLFQAGVYTFLPALLGLKISAIDGLIVFEKGALAANVAMIMYLYAFMIFLSIARLIWRSLRKTIRFNGRFMLVLVGLFALLIFAGIQMGKIAEAQKEPAGAGKIALLILLGVALVAWGFLGHPKKAAAGADAKKPGPVKSAPAFPTEGTPLERYEKVIAEWDRLTDLEDYASQIPLLTKAVELDLDGIRKARLWHNLGRAYEKEKDPEKAEACYRSALACDEGDHVALNNLALMDFDKKDYESALRHMDAAIAAAKARKASVGMYYGNYALIAGRNGDMSKAEDYLTLAKNAGYPDASIQKLRGLLGMK